MYCTPVADARVKDAISVHWYKEVVVDEAVYAIARGTKKRTEENTGTLKLRYSLTFSSCFENVDSWYLHIVVCVPSESFDSEGTRYLKECSRQDP